ncbi:MAG: SH3 domain-containing protein [Chloroflexota bacterium]
MPARLPVALIAIVLLNAACTLTAAPDAPPPSLATVPGTAPTPSAIAGLSIATQAPCRVVNDEILAIRISADIAADEVTILDAGTENAVIGRTGDNSYWYIRTVNDVEGWMASSAATLYGNCASVPILSAATVTPAATGTPSVPVASMKVNLNVRRGPSTRFNPPIGSFDVGDTVELTGVNPSRDWYRIRWQGGTGWIAGGAQFVDIGGNTASLPVDAGPPTPTNTPTEIPFTPTATLDPSTNYLRDPSFEGVYTGRDGFSDLNIPEGWNIRYYEEPRCCEWQNLRPVAFPHRSAPEIHEGELALNLNKDFATFTAVVYQQVTVPAGITVTASAWAWLHTCDPDPAICDSSAASGAKVRVGVDPQGGTDPLAERVVWSAFSTPHDVWGNVGVQAQATGSTVTLFLYATQDFPQGLNRVYWDDAKLVVGG